VTHDAERARAAWRHAEEQFDALQLAMATPPGATEHHVQLAWALAERVLEALSGEVVPPLPDPSSAATIPSSAAPLVSSVRARGLCTLDEAHVLIDLHASAARARDEPQRVLAGGDLAIQQVDRVRGVLEGIVRTALAPPVTSASGATPSTATTARAISHASTDTATNAGTQTDTNGGKNVAAHVNSTTNSTAVRTEATPHAADGPRETAGAVSRGRSTGFVIALVVSCLLGAGATALLFTRVVRTEPLTQGIEAYEAGQRTAARVAFEQARIADSTAALPLVYLGRLAREEGQLSDARGLLEQAVQLEPQHALTHRELAAALLADGEPELARRFYVRALTINANDRVAQGFLACALHQLGRADEAARWQARAGEGDWSACLTIPPAAPSTTSPDPR
jgi:hypothetical protein